MIRPGPARHPERSEGSPQVGTALHSWGSLTAFGVTWGAVANLLMLTTLCIFSTSLFAENPVGFLWYNIPKSPRPHQPQGVPFHQLSYTDKDAVLKFYTMEALHKVRFTHKLEDERVFLALQSFWLREATLHGKLNQEALRYYPEYDFSVTHPNSNIGTKLADRSTQRKTQAALHQLSKTHGLLFFYRGRHAFDQQQVLIMKAFCHQYHFTLMPVSVDGVKSPLLPHSKLDKGQAQKLGVRYFPAVLLVNPKEHVSIPITFGLTTQDVLTSRLFEATTSLQGKSK